MNIRSVVFWTLDKIRGGKISKHYQDIEHIMRNFSDNKSVVDVRLTEFLEYASVNTDYYKQYKGKMISEFPVISKEDLRKNRNAHLSKEFDINQLIKLRTSGSYGTPFAFPITKDKKNRQRAEVIFFSEWAKYYIGTKHIYIRANDNKSNFKLAMQNEIFIKTETVTEAWLQEQRNILLKSKAEVIIGFPTAIAEIAEYCIKKGDHPNDYKIKGVITSGESLYDHHRSIIIKAFNCICISRYSNEEMGVIAVECPKYNKHHLNIASYYVEILNENDDSHVNDGEMGRIVVTDLYSHAMPLIRYDTGDLAVYSKEVCLDNYETPIISSIEGRRLESIVKPNGDKLSPFFVNPIMSYQKNVRQFQFVQKGKKEYLLKIIGDITENDRIHLQQRFIEVLGEEANFKIEKVKAIPTLRSGKRAYVVNDYHTRVEYGRK